MNLSRKRWLPRFRAGRAAPAASPPANGIAAVSQRFEDALSVTLRDVLRVGSLFLLWRLLLFLFVTFSLYMSGGPPPADHEYGAFPGSYLLDGWFRWDSAWYARIALHGYFIEGAQSNVAFFPLFPYIARWLGVAFGSPFIGGWVINHLAALAGLVCVDAMARAYFVARGSNETSSSKDVTLALTSIMLSFPGALFFTAFYSESVFLCTTATSFYCFYKRRYWSAGGLGALAALTRSTGVLLLVAYSVDILFGLWKRRLLWRWSMLGVLLIPLGLGSFMAVLWLQVGNPLAFAEYQSGWARRTEWPWVVLAGDLWTVLAEPGFAAQTFVDAMSAVGALAAAAGMARHSPVGFTVWSLISVLVPLASGKTMSMMRFVAVIFPVFIYLTWKLNNRPMIRNAVVYGFTLLLALYSVRFSHGDWAG